MGGGAAVGLGTAAPPGKAYESHFTVYVGLVCVVASSAGLLFGFDNGIIGGVTGQADFQDRFLPDVYYRNFVNTEGQTNYCKFNSQKLQIIVSSLYLVAGAFAPLAGWTATRGGRKICLTTSGIAFAVGLVLLAAAQNYAMVILGRVFMGIGVAFANSSCTLYITEMAPAHLRGGLGILFQLVQTLGILIAYIYNYAFRDITWGWRLSVALGGVFAAIVSLGSLILPDTPPSLLNRGKAEQARRVLERVRGTNNVDAEFEEMVNIVQASQAASKNGFYSLLFNPKYRPQLAVVIAMPIFQQWTGINSVIFFTPQIFSYVGHAKGLEDTVVVGVANFAATLVASFTVDTFGRKILFTEGSIQMAITMAIIAATLGSEYGMHPDGQIPINAARGLLAVFCVFVSGYAWSYGPLPWLLPTEVQPLETRAAAASINVTLNMLMTFTLSQSFQNQLCAERFGVFIFFGSLTLLFGTLILLFLPETKGRTMDQIAVSFSHHWFWGRLKAVRAYGEERATASDLAPLDHESAAATAAGKGGIRARDSSKLVSQGSDSPTGKDIPIKPAAGNENAPMH